MAIYADSVNYTDSVAYAAVAQWAANTAYAAGAFVRQLAAPSAANARCFVCIVAGTSHATTEPTWTVTRGAKTTDNTVTWQECTGLAGTCGDLTNVATWDQLKAVTTPLLGAMIQRNSGGSLQICTTAGTMAASEPAFSNTAGVTTNDGTSVWTSLGAPGNFAAWKAPHAYLQNAMTTNWLPWSSDPAHLQTATGNGTLYVGDDHAETQSTSPSLTGSGAIGSITKILCVDHTKVPPYASGDLKTTGTITTTGNTSITISFTSANLYVYGLTFSASSGAVAGGFTFTHSAGWVSYDHCVFKKAGTNSAGGNAFVITANACRIEFNACQFFFGNAGDVFNSGTCELTFKNFPNGLLFTGSAVPNAFIQPGNQNNYGNIIFEDGDLSQLTSTTGFNAQAASTTTMGNTIIRNCKLPAAAPLSPTGLLIQAFGAPNVNYQFIGSDGAATSYKSAKYTFEGVELTETTNVRSGGAVDPTGQAQSRKTVVNPAAYFTRPYRAEPFSIYNKTTGANVTVTIYGACWNGALPKNDEVWVELEYLGTASFPTGVILSSAKANVFATSASLTSDASSWTSTVQLDGKVAGTTVTLSGLTVTHGSTTSGQGAMSAAAVDSATSTLKLYFETTVVSSYTNTETVGLCNDTISGYGSSSTGCGVLLGSGSTNVFSNGSSGLGNLGVTSVGDVFCHAVDFGNKLYWCRRNNGNWNGNASADPATGVGGATLASIGFMAPAVRFSNAGATDAITFNFGATAYAQTKPSGFSDWTAALTPFKIVFTLDGSPNAQPTFAGPITVKPRMANKNSIGLFSGLLQQGPTIFFDPRIELS